MTPLRRLVLALQFLTVATVWPRLRAQDRDLAGSMAYFPLIGLLLGAALAAARYWPLSFFPPVLADALTVALWVALTRGLHLEGVADVADGLIGYHGPDRALEIMKDPRSGPFASMAVALTLLIQWAALMSLSPGLKITVLVLAPVLGRWAMVLGSFKAAYARSEGLAGPFVDRLGWADLIPAGATALAVVILAVGAMGGAMFLGVCALVGLARLWLGRRIGGVTGDTTGALGIAVETAILLTFSIWGS